MGFSSLIRAAAPSATVAVLIGLAAHPVAAAPSRPAAVARCAGLVQRYRSDVDAASRYAAFNQGASEHLPGSQQGAAQTRESNAMARARMSLEAAKDAGCHPAAMSPSPEKYSRDADMCAVELIRSEWGGSLPEHCDATRWPRR